MNTPRRSPSSLEVSGPGIGPLAYPERPVCQSENRTAEVVSRLLRLAEDLARVAADVIPLLDTPAAPLPPAPVVVQAENSERTAWTSQEFAEAEGLNIDTVLRLLRSGELRGYKVNREWRIAETARVEWVAKKEAETAAELGIAS